MKILATCLENSANLHLKSVLYELIKREKIELYGIFSKDIENFLNSQDGCLARASYDSLEFNAMGFMQILPLIFKAKRAIKELTKLANSVDAVLLIDSPDFNLPLAKALKNAKIRAKITYYILPQVWAWRKGRAKQVEKYCDNIASIWPFEKDFYQGASFVGHPLLDEIKIQKNPQKSNKIVFMPGSRKQEISHLMPIFRTLAPCLNEEKIIVVPQYLRGKENEYYGDLSGFSLSYDGLEALANADFAFICSGTATLEAAIIGTPFVLCYKARAFDIWLAKKLVKIKHIGLANIIFDFLHLKPLHTELLQDELNIDNLLKAYHSANPSDFLQASTKLKSYLQTGSAKSVANIIMPWRFNAFNSW